MRQHTFDSIINSVASNGPKPKTILGIVSEKEYGGRHVIAWMVDKRVSLIVRLSLIVPLWVFPFLLRAQGAQVAPPNLNAILDSLERTGVQNPALSQPHELTREYKVFHGDDPKPMSDVTTQIAFTPPNVKTFKITDARGSVTGKKIVSAILEQEVASAKEGHQRDISRANYNFVFLHEQNFGDFPEYVLHIIPKRKEQGLLLGDIWVDAKTYRIRQIIGVPLKTPSFWIKDLHITVQFAEMNQMWLPVSVDAIAMVRFLGIYTLSGLDLAPPISASNTPNH
jgi:hypothetical protein